MAERFQNFVNGNWVEATGGATFEDLNPANKTESLGSFPRSDYRDVDRAVEAATGEVAAWRRVPAPRRAEVLFQAAEALERRKDEVAQLITQEMGKVVRESQEEVEDGIHLLRRGAGEGQRLREDTIPPDVPERLAMTLRVPTGVVAAITRWSAPLANPIRTLAPALVAGNTVVWKPAEDSPLTAARLLEILLEAGLPPGAVQLVHGSGEEAGAPLIRHPEVSLVAFTGSAEVGREVAIACAAEHKRVALELEGENAVLVMEDADLELAVPGTIWSGFGTSGQRRTAASRLLVHRKVVREFTERLVVHAEGLRVGDGLQATTDLGPLVNEARLKRVHGQTRVALREGAKLLCGGEVSREGDHRRGFFYPPTVLGEVVSKMRIAREEVSGPLLTITAVASLEEAVETANRTQLGLCTAIYTRDLPRALRAAEQLRAGVTLVNAPTTGAEAHLAFGGGRQAGDAFAEWKAVVIDYAGKPRRGQGELG